VVPLPIIIVKGKNAMELNIFEFTNFRDYLKAYYEFAKGQVENFSYRYFGLKAGFSSPNLLLRIIKGERNLSKDFIPKFAEAMGLSKKEQQYFDALVSFNQAKTPEAKRYYLELIHNLKKGSISTQISDDQYEYVSRWYYPVIREMVTLPDFSEDIKWLKFKLGNRLTCTEITEAIETLTRLGLLKRDEAGRLVQSEAHVKTSAEIADTGSYVFHQQMLSLAKDALKMVEAENREFSGVTMTISKKQLHEIKTKIREFENAIVQYLADNPDIPETVFQMNTILFPCTATPKGETI
jgi:uncharacterized protein (TIGR02147 family)